MEFERAIYRVYERSMEGLINEDGSTEQNLPFYKQSCRIFEYMVLMFGFLLLFILLFLHVTYVGSKGCLPEALTIFNSTTNRTTLREFSKDTILYISIDPNYLKKKGFSHSSLLTDDNTDDLGNHHSTSARRLLKEQSSQMSAFPSQRYNRKPNHLPVTQSVLTHLYEPLSNLFSYQSIIMNAISDTLMIPNVPISPFTDRRVTMMNTTTLPNNSTNNHTDTTPTTDPRDTAFLQPFDYVVTFDWAVTILDNELRAKHDFELVNITLPGHECFGSTFAESLLPFGGLDRAMLNNVMYTLRQSGYLWTKYGDLYHWHVNDLQLYNSVASWLNTKISILWYSCLAFFLLSTTTALLVRILISSGVILIFPIFWLMQCAGLNALNLRILTISYPWIGLPLQIIQFRQQSVYPFIIAHFIRVVLYYLLYIAAQSVYLKWLYNGTTFIQGQLWLYAVMMLWEYFSMIYVRSEYSILLFPRASLGLFLIFHFYYYSFPSGFHLLALFIMFIFLIYIMTYCIRRYEVKAFRQGLVNLDQPRMLYNSLPWPSWRAELSPEYTLFMPVNQRSRTIYQNQVPALHPQTENNNNNNNNNNNVNNTNPPNINPPNQAIPSNSNSNPSSSIPSPLTTSTMSIQNNIELSTFSPINATNTISNNNNNSNGGGSNSGRSSYIVVSDIESRMNTPNANTDNTATAANNSPVSFFTRFFTTPANYQSISNNSSHHNPLNTEGVERPSNPTSSQDTLRIPLTDASNPLQSTATSTSGPSRRNTNNR